MGRTGDGLGPLVCCRKACHGPNGEWGYSTRRHMLGPERTEGAWPDRALYLPTFSHPLIVNQLLSLSPHRRLWGPLGEGGALCHGRVNTAVPVGPPRPSSITHPESAPATVTCSYIGWHRWILGWGNLVHDTTTTKRSAVGNAWAGWDSIPVFFSLDGMSPVSRPTCEVPFPPRRSGECRKGISRPARCTREDVDRFGIPNPRKSGSVIGADRQRFGPSCVLPKGVPRAKRRVGV